MGCARCGSATRRVVFAHREVTACLQCHQVDWKDLAPPRTYGFRHHLACMQEEIRQAEKAAREQDPLVVQVQDARPGEGDRALLRCQVVEGDPRRVVRGSQVEATALGPPTGVAQDADVLVAQKHKGVLLLEAARRSWTRLPAQATLHLVPRSSAQIQRTLLQAYLLVRRLDQGLEDPVAIPRIPRRKEEAFTTGLRPSQARAVEAALSLREGGLLLVQGPPGTGKTTVIAALVRNALKRGQSVLISSHTHVAIDNALRRVLRQNPLVASRMVRIGDPQSVAPDMMPHTKPLLDFVDPPDEVGSRPLWRSLHEERPLVGMTLDGLAHGFVRHRDMPFEPFDLVIVDEAGMNLHPKLSVARAAGRRLVLVGDHEQLPPIVTAPGFRNDPAYCKSPFEVLQAARGDLLVLLDEQFRCHPDLYTWSADTMYRGRVTSRREPGRTVPSLLGRPLDSPVAWVDTSGLPGNQDERVDGSRVNPLHAAVCARIVQELVRVHGFDGGDIGVISPFRRQAEFYTESVRRMGWSDADVMASTVDAFQGDERAAIVLDLTTLAPAKPHEDPRRLNVSVTRVQDLLVIVGPRPFVQDPQQNPWLWSLQNWKAAQTLPFGPSLLPPGVAERLAQVPRTTRPVRRKRA